MIKARLIRLVPHAKRYIVLQVLWQWLGLLCQIMIVYSIASLTGFALAGFFGGTLTVWYLLLAAAGILLRFFFDRRAAQASYRAGADVKRILRRQIYEKMLRIGASYRRQTATSEVVQTAAEGVEQLETYFGRYLPQLFYAMLAPLTLFAVLHFQSMPASLVLLLCVPLIPVTIMLVQKIAKRLLAKYWDAYTGLGDSFLENLQGLTTLKLYRADEQKAAEMDAESERFRRVTMRVLTMQLNSTSVMDIIAYGGAAAGIIVTIAQLLAGSITLPGAMMIILLAAEFFIPMRVLGSYFHIAMNGMAASDRIFALLDLPEPEQGTVWLTRAGEKRVLAADCPIRMTDVDFSYDPARGILHAVSMEFPPGSLTALAGASGSGKSTIAGILTGQNRGYRGSITIGGHALSDIREDSLMQTITMVRHDSRLFKGTVRDNLRMAAPDATDADMEQALAEVNLLDFLHRQAGLDTALQENGANLSGGQRQRLALARALLHDTPVYIFDEAASNIDVESEEMIMQTIRRMAREKTVILISHRLANVMSADRIYMLEDGMVVQSGTHAQLMAAGGAYRTLYEQQQVLERFSQRGGFGPAGGEVPV